MTTERNQDLVNSGVSYLTVRESPRSAHTGGEALPGRLPIGRRTISTMVKLIWSSVVAIAVERHFRMTRKSRNTAHSWAKNLRIHALSSDVEFIDVLGLAHFIHKPTKTFAKTNNNFEYIHIIYYNKEVQTQQKNVIITHISDFRLKDRPDDTPSGVYFAANDADAAFARPALGAEYMDLEVPADAEAEQRTFSMVEATAGLTPPTREELQKFGHLMARIPRPR